MFSGIIAGMATVVGVDAVRHVLTVQSPLFKERPLTLGASIALNGVCLTLIAHHGDQCSFELGEETRKRTRLSQLQISELVNIEFSLRVGDDISGHFVQGHVDGCALLKRRELIDTNLLLTFYYPSPLRPLLVKKGSVTLNGVSLTINEIDDQELSVCLLPYTHTITILGMLAVGQEVHIEVDVLGRYVMRCMPSPIIQEVLHDRPTA